MRQSQNELTALINIAWHAVDKSLAGPIVGRDELGNEILRNPGYSTFLAVVQKVIPTVVDGSMEHSEATSDVT